MDIRFSDEEFVLLKNTLTVYAWGHKTLLTKLEILNEDFKKLHNNNPIEYIRGRIKSPESIATKMNRLNLDITTENAKKHIKDIAGIRIICAFAKDIYYLADILRGLPDVKTISEKDYITSPKPSGYRSYHMTLDVPVYYSGKTEKIPVEVQIRTAAMDFWATLEHKARYKYKEEIPQNLCDELSMCADQIAELDNRMFMIHDIISMLK